MITGSIEIGGYTFIYNCGMPWEGDGIAVPAEASQLIDDSDYLQCLKIAIRIYPYLYLHEYVKECHLLSRSFNSVSEIQSFMEQIEEGSQALDAAASMGMNVSQEMRDEVSLLQARTIAALKKILTREDERQFKVLRPVIYKRDCGLCRYCGTSLPETGYAVDHIVPRVLGGASVEANLVLACKRCNSRKNGRTPAEAGMTLCETGVTA